MEQQSKGATYQQEFDFDTLAEWARPHGDVTGATPVAKPARERQVFAAWKEATPRDERLLEAIADPGNLRRAYRKVKGNKGAPGIDGMTVEDMAQCLRDNLGKLRHSLLDGSYKPQDVRGKSIPKPNGGERRLGIPTVIDRVVQQAVVQVLTPILDPQMSESSYGFRPERSAHDALRQASAYAQEGRRVVVDLDLEKFFDRVNHDVLMARLAKRISDKRLLHYIRLMLKAGVVDERAAPSEPAPSSSPLRWSEVAEAANGRTVAFWKRLLSTSTRGATASADLRSVTFCSSVVRDLAKSSTDCSSFWQEEKRPAVRKAQEAIRRKRL